MRLIESGHLRQMQNTTDELHDYLLEHSLRESETLAHVRKESANHIMARQQIAPELGQFLKFMIETIQAKHILELGTYLGYSALAMSEAIPEDGKIITCDTRREWLAHAMKHWHHAGVSHKIEVRFGPAVKSLEQMLERNKHNYFDFAFIDADKFNYDNYYEACLKLVRPGGLIVIDNVLWSGKVIDPSFQNPNTLAIRALNEKLHHDERVSLSMVPIDDGLTLLRKR